MVGLNAQCRLSILFKYVWKDVPSLPSPFDSQAQIFSLSTLVIFCFVFSVFFIHNSFTFLLNLQRHFNAKYCCFKTICRTNSAVWLDFRSVIQIDFGIPLSFDKFFRISYCFVDFPCPISVSAIDHICCISRGNTFDDNKPHNFGIDVLSSQTDTIYPDNLCKFHNGVLELHKFHSLIEWYVEPQYRFASVSGRRTNPIGCYKDRPRSTGQDLLNSWSCPADDWLWANLQIGMNRYNQLFVLPFFVILLLRWSDSDWPNFCQNLFLRLLNFHWPIFAVSSLLSAKHLAWKRKIQLISKIYKHLKKESIKKYESSADFLEST